MCTSIVVNKKKTIVGWNLDLLDMEHRVRPTDQGVYIEINDAKEGWMPLFGANARGDFVGMPTCWPYDRRSDSAGDGENVILLDMDLLLQRKTLQEIRTIAETRPVYSIPGLTFMSALSDADGNVVYIIPGQGALYFERPAYKILTNFSPFKQDAETHPWMGWDRYHTAEATLRDAPDDFDVEDCFAVLRAVSQEVCPTVVSMVFDVEERTVYWCEDRSWDDVHQFTMGGKSMENKDFIIRPETVEDHREVENLVRESFWNVYRPGCSEHYVIHVLRDDPAFVKELDFVMEQDGRLIGQNMFMRTIINADDGRVIPVLTMGPIGITPELKRRGYGKKLLDYSLEKATALGYGAVLFEGNIGFYGKSGFDYARRFGIRYHDLPEGADDSFFLCKELVEGYLDGVTGVYQTPQGYYVADADVEEFDKDFPPKEKLKLPGQIFG